MIWHLELIGENPFAHINFENGVLVVKSHIHGRRVAVYVLQRTHFVLLCVYSLLGGSEEPLLLQVHVLQRQTTLT